ncbi:YdcF family protein [Candidatus Parcubacteria bacterium]|nr:YdcF family protein [Candidatus Parcubacteria bacterium]
MKKFYTFIALIFLVVAVVFTVNFSVHLFSAPYIYQRNSQIPNAEAAIILGASVISNATLSPILKDRTNTAIQLYNTKKIKKILVSGDNAEVNYNEVDPVRRYLLSKGVLDQDIFLDHAGFDTYSTMYRARDIFQVSSVLIVSQSFHLPRAVFIARKLGIDAYGVSADGGHILFANYLREVFANEKAMFDLITNAKPKYLGQRIPITGDGRNYQ